MKKIIYFVPVFLGFFACGKLFKPEEIKGPLAKPISAEAKKEIEELPNEQVRNLAPEQKEKLADSVFDYIQNNLDLRKTAKFACHADALFSLEIPSECEEARENCYKELEKWSDADLKLQLKKDEHQFKQNIKDSTANPKQFLAVFDLLESASQAAAALDCKDSTEIKVRAAQKFLEELIAKYGSEENAKAIEKLLGALVEYSSDNE